MTTYRAWNLKPLDRSALKELTAAIAQQSTEELENRAMETMDGEPWSEEKYQMTLAAQQKEVGLLAGILAARGITDPAEALTLLSGEEELTDPMLLTDMDKACARILQAIDNEETIVGHPKRQAANIHQFIISPIEAHSKKPDEARAKIISLMGDLPRVELFARQTPPGWAVWGNEVTPTIPDFGTHCPEVQKGV